MEGIAPLAALSWRDPAPILRPRSIGIIGASPAARWVPIFLEQIPQAGFRGPLWPINPSYKTIGDVPCYPSVRDTPEVPEHLIMHVATERTLAVLEEAAAAERKAARLFSDPLVEVSHARGRVTEGGRMRGTEKGFSITQSIPWPASFAAEIRAADRGAEALRAEGADTQWELVIQARRAFASLLYARTVVGIAHSIEADARSLKDLADRRAELGESREAERIKATVEWLRRQRDVQAAKRGAEAAESILRTLAVEPLPVPLVLGGELPRAGHGHSGGPRGPRAARRPTSRHRERRSRAGPRGACSRASGAVCGFARL